VTEPRPWTVVDLLRWTTEYLAGKGVGNARLNGELLLGGTLGLRRLDLYLQFDRPLTPEELSAFRERIRRRARREPLQYIDGSVGFRDLTLRVDRRVLIPRPETEGLVQAVLDWSSGSTSLRAVDVGTGSGCIALALATEGPFAEVIATDASGDALEVARANHLLAAPGAPVSFRAGDLLDPVAGEQFDVVVSNPPYVGTGEADALEPEVREWEPPGALFAGATGLDVYTRLIPGAAAVLRPGGLLALEIGATQGPAVVGLIGAAGAYEGCEVKPDLSGRPRVVVARRT
jgi:release factor glutamine methyltransferase